MHSYDSKTATFFFDGDFGGKIIISPKDENGNHLGIEVRVNSKDLLNLIAYNYVQSELIGKIERMEAKELINKLPEVHDLRYSIVLSTINNTANEKCLQLMEKGKILSRSGGLPICPPMIEWIGSSDIAQQISNLGINIKLIKENN